MAQVAMVVNTGSSERPSFVNEYSVRGGTSGNAFRQTIPSCSSSRKCLVSILWEALGTARLSSLKRRVSFSNSWMIGHFQRPPSTSIVVSAGQFFANDSFGRLCARAVFFLVTKMFLLKFPQVVCHIHILLVRMQGKGNEESYRKGIGDDID